MRQARRLPQGDWHVKYDKALIISIDPLCSPSGSNVEPFYVPFKEDGTSLRKRVEALEIGDGFICVHGSYEGIYNTLCNGERLYDSIINKKYVVSINVITIYWPPKQD
jgi:hypothetical protein